MMKSRFVQVFGIIFALAAICCSSTGRHRENGSAVEPFGLDAKHAASGDSAACDFANTGDGDIEALDTARNVSYLSAIEKDIVPELNKVRIRGITPPPPPTD
jgi:hypothetical protein